MEMLPYEPSARLYVKFLLSISLFSHARLKYASQEKQTLHRRLKSFHPKKSITYKRFLKDVQKTCFY